MKNIIPIANNKAKKELKLLSKKDFSGAVAKVAVKLSPYSCPDDLARVIIKADGAWPLNDIIDSTQFIREWSYDEFTQFVHNFVFNTAEVQAWGNAKSGKMGHRFVTLYDAPGSLDDDFVDLYALSQNIVNECWSNT